MSAALVLKELREHRWLVALAWAIAAITGILRTVSEHSVGSPFAGYRVLMPVLSVFLALAFSNRLVVREYSARTQLFLESLPLTRARVLTTKWVVGAVWTLVPVVAMLLAAAVYGRTHAQLEPAFVAAIGARMACFALFFWALAFLVGVLGRYRYVTWGALIIGMYLLDKHLQTSVDRLAPLQLLDETLIIEGAAVPWVALVGTLGLTAGLVLATAAVTLGGEGAWVAALAHRMSHREKVGFVVALVVPMALSSVFEARKKKPAFDLSEAVKSRERELIVGVARPEDLSEDAAKHLASALASDLSGLVAYLGMTELPAVFVVPDAAIDGDLFMRAELPAADGVVLKGALGSDRFDLDGFRAFAAREVMTWHSRGRVTKEERRWLLDGFALGWPARENPARQKLLTARARAAAAALQPSARTFAQWESTRETLGDCLADALAFEAVGVALEGLTADERRALIRDALGVRPPDDARAWLTERSTEALLEQHGAPTLDALAAKLRDRLAAGEAAPFASLEVSGEKLGGRLYELRFAPRGGLPDTFALRYFTLSPWSAELTRADLGRFDATGAGVLPTTVVKGERLFVAAEVRDDALQCTLRVGARRWEVQ